MLFVASNKSEGWREVGQREYICVYTYAKTLIVVKFFFLEHFGAMQLGSIAYKLAFNMYRKVEET